MTDLNDRLNYAFHNMKCRQIETAFIVDPEPRRVLDKDIVRELADDIVAVGLQYPIGLCPEPDNAITYRLIWGAHRLHAFQLLEKEGSPAARTIPAFVLPTGTQADVLSALAKLMDIAGKMDFRHDVRWTWKRPTVTMIRLGLLPEFIYANDPRSAKEQIAERYQSGWCPVDGFAMRENGDLGSIEPDPDNPDEPDVSLLAEGHLRDEIIRFYELDLVAVMQSDGSYEVARVD